MKVREAMTPEMTALDAQCTIQEAAARMKDDGASAMLVFEEGKMVGVLTERDIVTRFVAEGLDYSGTTASDVMTREPVCCREDDELESALALMRKRETVCLVVVDAQGKPTGILEASHETHPRRESRPRRLG